MTTAPAPAALVCEGRLVAPAEVPVSARGRARGLLGRDGIAGVMVLRPCRHVHTFRMRFPIDVAFCDRGGTVLRVCTLPPGRLSPLVWRAAWVLEAEAGAFARWGVVAGARVAVEDVRGTDHFDARAARPPDGAAPPGGPGREGPR